MPKKEEASTENVGKTGEESTGLSLQANEAKAFQHVTILVVYYFATLLFSFWVLFDVWSRNFTLFRGLGV